jgi:nitroimidazol reductase NimA-like FMN-containing flavoprotein (pyridoxamine 5'-phosphate oxidase superfamily)
MAKNLPPPGVEPEAPESYAVTERTRLRRRAARGSYDRATVHAILDEAFVCHVGFLHEGEPFVMPTAFVRDGELLYVHGAAANRMLASLAGGGRACVTVTLLDGLVLARSYMHHSMNYRSVVVLGAAREVTDSEEKRRAFAALIERVERGRSERARPANDAELRMTRVFAFPLEEVSAKTRSGPPLDDPEDLALPYWAGVIPLSLTAGAPIPDTTPERVEPTRPRAESSTT